MKKILKKILLMTLSIILTLYSFPINISEASFTTEDLPYDIKFKNVYRNIAIDENGYLWLLGYYYNGEDYVFYDVPTKIIENVKFKQLDTAGDTYLAIDENNTLWGWGHNMMGTLRQWNYFTLFYTY